MTLTVEDVTRSAGACPYCTDRPKGYGTMTAHVLLCAFRPAGRLHFPPLPPELGEVPFQRIVSQLATGLGWTVCHVRPGKGRAGDWVTPTTVTRPQGHGLTGAPPGFPDLFIARPGRLVVLELKTDEAARKKLRPEQVEWIGLLASVPGVDAFFAHPALWPDVIDLLLPTG